MHNFRSRLGVLLVAISALLGIQSGILFLFVFHEFREYHAVVADTSWTELSTGMQTVVYCLLKIVGGGFMAYGVGLACLVVPIARNEHWARGCGLCLSISVWAPTLYACYVLMAANPATIPPTVSVCLVLLLPIVGILLSYRPAKTNSIDS